MALLSGRFGATEPGGPGWVGETVGWGGEGWIPAADAGMTRGMGRSATRRRDRSSAWAPGFVKWSCVVMGPMVHYLSTAGK